MLDKDREAERDDELEEDEDVVRRFSIEKFDFLLALLSLGVSVDAPCLGPKPSI